jgi:hypothetical protein
LKSRRERVEGKELFVHLVTISPKNFVESYYLCGSKKPNPQTYLPSDLVDYGDTKTRYPHCRSGFGQNPEMATRTRTRINLTWKPGRVYKPVSFTSNNPRLSCLARPPASSRPGLFSDMDRTRSSMFSATSAPQSPTSHSPCALSRV